MGSRKYARVRAAMAALAVVLLSAFAVACGDDEKSSGGSGGSGGGSSGELTKLRVGFVAVTPSLPITVAIKEGIFKKNGLDVEYTKTLSATNAAIGRQFEIGQSTASDFLASVEGGLDHVLVSHMMDEGESTTALMASQESGIKSIEDMAGKSLGIPSRSSGIAQSTMYLLREAGVDPKSVKIQEMPFPTMADQLAAGRVDVVGPVEPFAGQIRGSGKATELLNPLATAFKDAGGDEERDGVLFATATREWAEQNPDAIEAWRKSIAEAGEFMKANPEKAAQHLAAHAEIPLEIASKTPLYETFSEPVKPEDIAAWIEVMRGGDLVKNPDELDPESLVYQPNG